MNKSEGSRRAWKILEELKQCTDPGERRKLEKSLSKLLEEERIDKGEGYQLGMEILKRLQHCTDRTDPEIRQGLEVLLPKVLKASRLARMDLPPPADKPHLVRTERLS